jgi:glycosyltransferase involved in cell wall biosynthesis
VRVLILHSRYLSGSTSGENRVVDDEAELLRNAGHEVALVQPSMEGVSGRARLARAAAEVVWSPRAVRAVRGAIGSFRPDIVHVHNLFPALSPAVLRAAPDIPLVMTLHNYRLLCLPGTLYRDGKVCEDCVGRAPLPGVRHACYRGSRGASAALATSQILHRAISTYDRVSLFVAVSEFVRDRHVAAGMDPDRFVVKPNFAWPVARREGPGDRFLYLGRLSEEKGVETLLEAWRAVDVPLDIIGDGPLAADLRAIAPPSVNFVGAIPGDRVPERLSSVRALVVSSRWYEAAPRVIAEAFAAGVPVIASDIGALPGFVVDGVNGVLAVPGDPSSWRDAARKLIDDDTAIELGRGAYRSWQEDLAPDACVAGLLAAYDRARERHVR